MKLVTGVNAINICKPVFLKKAIAFCKGTSNFVQHIKLTPLRRKTPLGIFITRTKNNIKNVEYSRSRETSYRLSESLLSALD